MNGTSAHLTGTALILSRLGRGTILHAVAVVAIALLTFASYALLDRALHAGRQATIETGMLQSQRMLSQRIASLAAQYALGNTAAGRELNGTIEAFASSERLVLVGDAARELPPAHADKTIRAVYYGGRAPLAAVITNYLAGARALGALPPHDPRLATLAAPIFSVAEKPLLDGLGAALAVRQMGAQRSLTQLGTLGAISALALLATLLAETFGIVVPMVRRARQLARDNAEFSRIATTDPLTGTLNKRGFQDRGAVEIHKAKRYNRPLSLLMIDPDHFDPITKAHGMSGFDTVLKALTSTLFEGTRVTDLVGRVGGDEFAILLPETDLAGAELLAERLRRSISDLTVPIDNSVVSCTVSIGVSAAEKDATFFWPTFARADEALYEAKMRGRNRVFVNAA